MKTDIFLRHIEINSSWSSLPHKELVCEVVQRYLDKLLTNFIKLYFDHLPRPWEIIYIWYYINNTLFFSVRLINRLHYLKPLNFMGKGGGSVSITRVSHSVEIKHYNSLDWIGLDMHKSIWVDICGDTIAQRGILSVNTTGTFKWNGFIHLRCFRHICLYRVWEFSIHSRK